ncbi:hypothetical protein QBC47DRAFT_127299 [Echria macrotheca]|uniref:Uncharacterized protein n=1 Tax=Echria macrotheca TaxID=438768 RepID=A0AAJ0F693_9PEZI|nr:hypothetical protein QBC47DRAFT_127299 [Echria macrotheca]
MHTIHILARIYSKKTVPSNPLNLTLLYFFLSFPRAQTRRWRLISPVGHERTWPVPGISRRARAKKLFFLSTFKPGDEKVSSRVRVRGIVTEMRRGDPRRKAKRDPFPPQKIFNTPGYKSCRVWLGQQVQKKKPDSKARASLCLSVHLAARKPGYSFQATGAGPPLLAFQQTCRNGHAVMGAPPCRTLTHVFLRAQPATFGRRLSLGQRSHIEPSAGEFIACVKDSRCNTFGATSSSLLKRTRGAAA